LDHPESKDPQHGLCEKSPRTISLVTGQIEKDHEFCSTYRISACGQKARFFEPILGLDVANELPDSKVFPITVHTAPKREWAGLTEDEVIELLPVGAWDIESTLEFSQSIEAKLKEKNHV
jgi:hypothetical protein